MQSDFAAATGQHPTPDPTINPKQLQGLWIPAEYLYADDLSTVHTILMSYLRMMDQDRNVFASNQYLSELMGVKATRIRNMLVQLAAKGYIETIRRNPRVIKCLK